MKTNSRRYRRHRNPEVADKKEGPFFSPASNAIQTKEDTFFQPKLAVGQPGDKYEREADAVADKVVSQQPAKGNSVQRKEISAVQAMPEKKEEEKKVQKKNEVDKEEEKTVQKKDDQPAKEEKKPELNTGKKEEEKPVQKKDDKSKEEEKLQKKDAADEKEEEKPVQKKEEPEKKPAADEVLKEEKEEKKDGKPSVMAKESNSRDAQGGGDQLAQQLKDQRGDGSPLPREVRNEMGTSIGADFSNVRIHTGEKAAALSDEIGAQAFTHGNDVYFNSGKYDTDSSAGRHLLAHELTHVVQQGAAPAMEGKTSSAAATHSTPGVQREISTPLPEGVKPDEKSEVANFPIGSFKVEIRPDRKATEEENIAADHAHTSGSIDAVVSYERNKSSNKITKVTISKTLIIQTIYGADATSKGDSGYGRGFIKSDRDKGNKSLGFHEGNHGIDFMEYIKTHPFPEIVIKKPVTDAEFATLKAEWDIKHKAYVDDMLATSKKNTDDVKDPPAPATP